MLQGYRKSEEFIVTQYPLESTKEDFWRMVWDRNSPVIIVLQSEEEAVSACMSPLCVCVCACVCVVCVCMC